MTKLKDMYVRMPLEDEGFMIMAKAVMKESRKLSNAKEKNIQITNIEVHYDPLDRNDYCVISGRAI